MTKLRYFNTGYVGANFFTEQDAEGHELVEVKKALVATEGSFKDSQGTEHVFTQDRLNTIAEHTNNALSIGTDVPVCVDHKKTVDSTVGNIAGQAYTKVITEQDLPNPKATHLVGKLGLFIDGVTIKAKDAVEKVKNKIISSVSMGLNLDPKDHRIMELSLVPIPAIPNMGLFKAGFMDESNVFTWEDLETTEETIDDLKEEFDNLTDNLWKILNNIYTSESIDITDINVLKQYVYNALNGFSLRVVDTLGLSDPAMGATDPAAQTAEEDMAAQQTTMQGVSAGGGAMAGYSKEDKTAKFSRGSKYKRANFSKYVRTSKYSRVPSC